MSESNDRHRASAAIFRKENTEILLVRHERRDGSTYWQLPGGGLSPGETDREAVLRELEEETGLKGIVGDKLFTIPYKYGLSSTYRVTVAEDAEPVLGVDPEDTDSDHRKLVEVAWRPFSPTTESREVEELLTLPAFASDLTP